MTALLVKHPRGDFLIDTGFGSHIDTQIRTMPLFFRAVTSYQRARSASEQLDAVGYDRKGLSIILPPHTLTGITSAEYPTFRERPFG